MSLQVYIENGGVSNELFKREIREKMHATGNYQSKKFKDQPALLKKSEMIRYFGLIDYSFKDKYGSINEYGKKFYEGNKETRVEIIFDRMRNISFGRNNSAYKSSNSSLNPPMLLLKVMKEYGSITRKEFAYLLECFHDKKLNYAETINKVIGLAGELLTVSKDNKNKYADPKFTVFFKDLEIIYEIDRRLFLNPRYINLIEPLKIYSDDDKEYNNVLKDDTKIVNMDIVNASNNRDPILSDQNSSKRLYKTDSKLKNKVLMDNDYKCEIDPSHKTFLKQNGDPFMEGHHLIPMKAQKDFEVNIDRTENIICICPNCHRAVHHANRDVKFEILEKLFSRRKKLFRDVGMNIDLDDIFKKYYT